MSFFRAKCPHCGEEYVHIYVGSTLHSGHVCPQARADALEAATTPVEEPEQPELLADDGFDV